MACPKKSRIFRKNFRLKSGNTMSIFFNRDNELLVVDKIRKDNLGGNEIVRKHLKEVGLPTKKTMRRRR